MDELLQKAIQRRDMLRNELAAVETFILSYSPMSERRISATGGGDLFADFPAPAPEAPARKRSEQRVQITAAMDQAEKAILQAGRPLTRSQLLDLLEQSGHEIDGTDKSKVLGTNLWRSKRFINLKKVGYWPVSAPIPPEFASYRPRFSQFLDDGSSHE